MFACRRTCKCKTAGFSCTYNIIQKGFVQVLSINKSHWITVSSMNCQQSTIKVYDSFHGYTYLPEGTKKLIADIMQSPCLKIEVQYIDVQKQQGQSDLGCLLLHLPPHLPIFKTLQA